MAQRKDRRRTAKVRWAVVIGAWVIVDGEVQQAAVVPHDEVARAPTVPGLVLGAGGVGEQVLEQRGALRTGPADKLAREHSADIQRPAAGLVVCSNHRMRGLERSR